MKAENDRLQTVNKFLISERRKQEQEKEVLKKKVESREKDVKSITDQMELREAMLECCYIQQQEKDKKIADLEFQLETFNQKINIIRTKVTWYIENLCSSLEASKAEVNNVKENYAKLEEEVDNLNKSLTEISKKLLHQVQSSEKHKARATKLENHISAKGKLEIETLKKIHLLKKQLMSRKSFRCRRNNKMELAREIEDITFRTIMITNGANTTFKPVHGCVAV